MKQEDFWMGDADFFAGMMSKVTDLSKNLYLLVTDLQKNQTFVPEKTAEFLGMEAKNTREKHERHEQYLYRR